MGLKDRRSKTDVSTDSVLYLFDTDIAERNALRAATGLPLLDRESQRPKEKRLGRVGNCEGTENWAGIGLSSATICAVRQWERNEMVFRWFKSEKRERRRKVKLDRKHLKARSRRFLKSYLNADETRKPQFYRAVEEASKQCQPVKSGLPPPELEDAQIAEATSGAALQMVLAREERGALDDRISDFVTDAYATVGIAYHRAAGVYTMDKEMQELGTAAVHLLTMATSYMRAHND